MEFKNLLLVGASYSHTINFYHMIKDNFVNVQLFSNKMTDGIPTTVFNFSLKNILTLSQRIDKLKKAIQDFHPDIIHIHQANSFAFLTIRAAKDLNIPIVTTLWGSDVLIMPKRNFLLRQMFKYIVEKSDYLTADAIVLKKEAEKYTKKKLQIEIANYGIDFVETEIVKENLIYSNRLHKPLYRIDKIVRDFIKWKVAHPKWQLLIGATGQETEKLKEITKINKASDIEFCGWVEKMENIRNYARSKVYVSIPESDGTSMSLLEAMYYKCFPIVSDLPANREWIVDGKNGIVIQAGEGVFDRFASMDIDNVIDYNRKLVEEKGSKSANKQIFLNIYKSLLN